MGLTHFMFPFMYTTVTFDKAGRIVTPKTLREELHLEPGDRMELHSKGDEVTLRPVRLHLPSRKTGHLDLQERRKAEQRGSEYCGR